MSSRIGIRQLLAPGAAVALIAGGVLTNPDLDGPSMLESADRATAAVSNFLTPPDESVELRGTFAAPLTATTAGGGTYANTSATNTDTVVMLSQRDDDGVYEVTIKNGEMTAKVNGKEVPDRVEQNGDSIVILDEEGNVLASFTVGQGQNSLFGAVSPRTLVLDELKAVPQVRTFGSLQPQDAPKVMIGITMSDAPNEILEGIVVDRVLEGLPAGKAGLEAGDIIVSIKGLDGVSQQSLRGVLRKKSPGDELHVRVLRGGDVEERVIKLEKYDGTKLGVSVAGVPASPFTATEGGAPNAFTFNFEHDEDIQKAIEKAMSALKDIDHDAYTEEALRALEQAMKQYENGQWHEKVGEFYAQEGGEWREKMGQFYATEGDEWREKMGNFRFNVEVDPEIRWHFLSDDEGHEFVVPKESPNNFHWETDDRAQELENRLERLEEKLQRLEKIIEKLTDDL